MTVFDSHPRRASGPATYAAGLPLPRCRFFPSPRTGSGPNRTQRNRYTNPVNTASADRSHTLGTFLQETMGDARLTAETLGHRGLASVSGYTKITDVRRREAYEQMQQRGL